MLPGGAPRDVALAPFTSVDPSTDVILHAGPAGHPTLTLDGCRGLVCGTWAVDLATVTARLLALPRPPEACLDTDVQFDGPRLYLVRVGAASCRRGLYQVIGNRAVRRLAGSEMDELRVVDGLAVWERQKPGDELDTQLVDQQVGGRRVRVLQDNPGYGEDTEFSYYVQPAGRWIYVIQILADRGSNSVDWLRLDPSGGRVRCSELLGEVGTTELSGFLGPTELVYTPPDPGDQSIHDYTATPGAFYDCQ